MGSKYNVTKMLMTGGQMAREIMPGYHNVAGMWQLEGSGATVKRRGAVLLIQCQETIPKVNKLVSKFLVV